jgi:glutamine synthetase
MDLEQIVTFLEQHGIRKVKLAGADLDGILRGKYVSLEKFASAARHGFGFCDVLFGWDSQDECYDFPAFTGWHTGYPDTLARIDLHTMRIIPWEPGTALFLCDFWRDAETPLPVCPRNLLKRVAARAEGMGFRPRASVEYEFWIFRETPQTLQAKRFQGLTPLSPGSFGYSVLRASQNARLVHDILDACSSLQVGLEGLHTETGPGVYEAAIVVEDALEAADQAALFKTTVKEIASRYECVATFMARWSADHAGSGGHLHQSLWSPDGETNLFHNAESERGLSVLMRQYLGGVLALMPHLMPMVCPTVNSYKRLVPGYWAPTHAAWGVENRTAALRAIPGLSPGATRLEYRLPGADANPYLALAAGLASGLHGIQRELEPPPPVSGSAYESGAPPLPRALEEATERFRNSPEARDLFGEEFVGHFAGTRDWEVGRFRQAVTGWELERYFEII